MPFWEKSEFEDPATRTTDRYKKYIKDRNVEINQICF